MTARLQQMGRSRAALWAVALAGILAAIAAVKLSAHPPAGRPTEPGPALEFLVGAALFGCGLASWHTRPENRLGPAMVLIGFAWFAEELNNATTPWLNTLGIGVQSYWIAGMLYLLLSFPSGRLTRLERRLMGVALAGRQPATGGAADREPGRAVVRRMRAQRRPGVPRQRPGARPAQVRAAGRPDPGRASRSSC